MKPSLGIEITDRYLKLAAASSAAAKGSSTLEFAAEPIANNLPNDQIIKKIGSFLQKTRFRPAVTTICIPRNMLTVKTLQLPTRDSKESEQMIDLHLARLVPYRKEEILFGHSFLGVNAAGYATELLAIVHRDTVKRQCAIVEGARLSVDNIVLSSYGAWQWLLSNFRSEIKGKDLYMLLDVDYSFADLVIFSAEQLLFSRTIAVEPVRGSLEAPAMTKLMNEIKQSLIVFYNEAIGKKPIGIFIAGAPVTGLRERVGGEFNLPVREVPSPWSRYAGGKRDMNLPSDISLDAVSELALEDNPGGISFILPEVQVKKSLKEKRRKLLILGALLIYFFGAITAFFVVRLQAKQAYLNDLNGQGAVIEGSVGLMIGQAKKIEFVKDFLRVRKEPLAILQELQKITPQKIAVDYIGLDNGYNITLRGEGEQLSDVFEFTTVLEKSPYFENVVTKRTRTKRAKNREVTDFEVTLNTSIK